MTVRIQTIEGTQELSSEAFACRLAQIPKPCSQPFSTNALSLLTSLSRALLNHPQINLFPQVLALGFWLRPSAVQGIRENHFVTSPNLKTVARGLAFHLPPSNVDTLFVYSWALSLLAGNSNIVRLPAEMSDATQLLVDTICQALDQHNMTLTQLFCNYDRNDDYGRQISALSDIRVIWGGDEKVTLLSRDPLLPDGISIGFPDRTSFCVISDSGFRQLDYSARKEIAVQLYSDIFWFDQLGCGSPRAICWLGGDKMADVLYGLLDDVIRERQPIVETGTVISKFVHANELIAAARSSRVRKSSNELNILETDIQSDILEHSQGGGFLLHCVCPEIAAIEPLINRKLQTVTHAGLAVEDIDALAMLLNGGGGLRLVPVGDALSFGPVWDGYDLLSTFTQKIVVDYGRERKPIVR